MSSKIRITQDSIVSYLALKYIHRETYTRKFIAALFVIIKDQENHNVNKDK